MWVWLRLYGCVCLFVFLWMKLTAAIFVFVLLSIIATPGRLLHILVEMNKNLREIIYVVFDEADRSVQKHRVTSGQP